MKTRLTVLILVVAISFGAYYKFTRLFNSSLGQDIKESISIEKPVFTHNIFDPSQIIRITPLGELNGGYIETQTIGSVMMDIAPKYYANGGEIDVFAPTDMQLVSYAYYEIPPEPANWTLEFQITRDVSMRVDHLTGVVDKIKNIADSKPAPDSRTKFLATPIDFASGEQIAMTSGTSLAHNWNIYLYDKSVINQFVNMPRYENHYIGEKLINGACPFDYYEVSPLPDFDCGNVSKDVRGALSGMWHLDEDGIAQEYRGKYATPLSIYKTQENRVIIFEIDRKRFIVDSANRTFKDPATITTFHCFQLFSLEHAPLGYAYFRVDSDSQMSLSYSSTGNCPDSFPASGSIKYFR